MIGTQLFNGVNLRLASVDVEKDAAQESVWTHDLVYAAQMHDAVVHPLRTQEIKKKFQEWAKESIEKSTRFFFAIRQKTDDRLIGFVHLPWISWSNRSTFLRIGIGEIADLHQYGGEALEMALGFIFNELNLYRVTAPVPGYNLEYTALYERAGFVLEVRQREMCYRSGQRWDLLLYGCLAEEWQKLSKEVES
jgi:RimJ/RimL family protein N-acetyltransferase